MIARDIDAYHAQCDATHPSDSFVAKSRSASPLSQHTPSLAVAANEEETVVVDECSHASHEALKQSRLWSTLDYVGIQHDIDDHGRDASLTMRNCGRCGSTLCKPATARERLIDLLCKNVANDEAVTSALALADEMAGVA